MLFIMRLLINKCILLRSYILTLIAYLVKGAFSSHHHFDLQKCLLLLLKFVLLLKKLLHFLILRTEGISIYFKCITSYWSHLLNGFEMASLVLTLTKVVDCIVYFEWVLCNSFLIIIILLFYWWSHIYLSNICLVDHALKFITYWYLILIEKNLIWLKL